MANKISIAEFKTKTPGGKRGWRAIEAPIQRAFFKLAQIKLSPEDFALLFAIPNGGRRDARTAALMKAEGVKAGVWDIFFAMPREVAHGVYEHGLWLECKGKTSLSKPQKEFEQRFRRAGYAGAVFRDAVEACRLYRIT